MKFLASLALLAIAGCAASSRPGPAPTPDRADDARESVDRLRVDTVWHPPSTGGQGLSCSYELPERAYIAQGWPWDYYRSCEWERPVRWSRSCRPSVTDCAPRFR